MVSARSILKKAVRDLKYEQCKQRTDRLLHARVNNAKEYWKMLKEASNINTDNSKLSTDSFVNYFKAINNPETHFFKQTKIYSISMNGFCNQKYKSCLRS